MEEASFSHGTGVLTEWKRFLLAAAKGTECLWCAFSLERVTGGVTCLLDRALAASRALEVL